MKLSEYLKIGTKMKILRKEKGISQKEMVSNISFRGRKNECGFSSGTDGI